LVGVAAYSDKFTGKLFGIVWNVQNEEAMGLHAVFLARSQQELLSRLHARASGLPLLIVTESEQGLDDGATINFTVKNGRVSFEVALDNAQQQRLHLNAQMLKVASNVRGETKP
jgi:hypothetical protein